MELDNVLWCFWKLCSYPFNISFQILPLSLFSSCYSTLHYGNLTKLIQKPVSFIRPCNWLLGRIWWAYCSLKQFWSSLQLIYPTYDWLTRSMCSWCKVISRNWFSRKSWSISNTLYVYIFWKPFFASERSERVLFTTPCERRASEPPPAAKG